ncbi:hypothetical protein C8R47DRAFT_503100 [Mycena vitilis]|nr:hypothetical protein C8R47DRAFT_503100 [Mycena vitilis]
MFGSVVSIWPGAVLARTLAECKAEELAWVARYRRETEATVQARLLEKVREAVADVNLFLVPSGDLDLFTELHGTRTSDGEDSEKGDEGESEKGDEGDSEEGEGEEDLLLAHKLSKVDGLSPGFGWDVLLVTTAKAVVREARYLVATALHGDEYRTPLLIQAPFGAPVDAHPRDFLQGEAGTWYEVSRYGAFSSPMLVSDDFDSPTLATCSLELVGHIGQGGLSAVRPSIVKAQAEKFRAGTFMVPQKFFTTLTTAPVLDYVFRLRLILSGGLVSGEETGQIVAGESSSAIRATKQPPNHKVPPRFPFKLARITSKTDLREVAYYNHPVVHGRSLVPRPSYAD